METQFGVPHVEEGTIPEKAPEKEPRKLTLQEALEKAKDMPLEEFVERLVRGLFGAITGFPETKKKPEDGRIEK